MSKTEHLYFAWAWTVMLMFAVCETLIYLVHGQVHTFSIAVVGISSAFALFHMEMYDRKIKDELRAIVDDLEKIVAED